MELRNNLSTPAFRANLVVSQPAKEILKRNINEYVDVIGEFMKDEVVVNDDFYTNFLKNVAATFKKKTERFESSEFKISTKGSDLKVQAKVEKESRALEELYGETFYGAIKGLVDMLKFTPEAKESVRLYIMRKLTDSTKVGYCASKDGDFKIVDGIIERLKEIYIKKTSNIEKPAIMELRGQTLLMKTKVDDKKLYLMQKAYKKSLQEAIDEYVQKNSKSVVVTPQVTHQEQRKAKKVEIQAAKAAKSMREIIARCLKQDIKKGAPRVYGDDFYLAGKIYFKKSEMEESFRELFDDADKNLPALERLKSDERLLRNLNKLFPNQ